MPILSTLCHLLAFCIFLSNFAMALLEVKGIKSSNGRWTIAGTERQHSLGKLEQRWGQTHPFQQVQAQQEHLNRTAAAAAERGSTSIGPSVIMAAPGDDHRMPALGDGCLPEAGTQKAPEAEEEHDEFYGSNVNGSAGGQQCAMMGRHGEPENDVNKQQPNTTTALPVTDFKMPKMSPIVPNPLLERSMDLFGSPSPFAGLPMPSTSDARGEVPFPPAPIDIRQLPGFMSLLNQIPSMLNSFTSRTNKDAELLGEVAKEDPSKNNLFPRQPTAVALGVPNLQHSKHGVVVDQSENGYDGGEAQMLGEKGMRRAKFVLNTAPTRRSRPQFDIERLTMDKLVQQNLFENEGDKKQTSEEFFQPAQTVRKKPSTTTTIILSPNKYKVSYNKHTLPSLPRQMPSGDDQLDKNGIRRTKGIQLGQLDQSMLNELLAVSELPDFGQLTQGMDLTLLHKPGGFAMLKQQFIERLQQKAMMAESRKKDYHF
uniref:Uncharacterized protein n=1 Tax=Globodera pallida TaxID=36090 RepID=A0A183C5G6_GLOPA